MKQKGKVDSTIEFEVVVQSLRLNTLSKLTFADSKRFDSLLMDVFPGVEHKVGFNFSSRLGFHRTILHATQILFENVLIRILRLLQCTLL